MRSVVLRCVFLVGEGVFVIVCLRGGCPRVYDSFVVGPRCVAVIVAGAPRWCVERV